MRKPNFPCFAVMALLLWPGVIRAQATGESDLLKQASKLQLTNDNAAALDLLLRYGEGQVQAHKIACDSISAHLTNVFQQENAERVSKENAYNQRIMELRAESEDLERENFKMIRNTLLLFGLLTGILVLILLNRFRTLHALKKSLIFTENRINRLNSVLKESTGLKESIEASKVQREKIIEMLKPARPTIESMISDKHHSLHKTAVEQSNIERIVDALLIHEIQDDPNEKVPVDLNRLIEEVQQQAYFYMSSRFPDFQCTVQPDLEKILPPMQVRPVEIRHVVFSLLLNAFEAVYEKRLQSPKGYEPKVSIVTRKLPKFVQIRIKDNGSGIPEKSQQFIFDPFYSLKDPEHHSGLGLSESRRIIQQVHKGELFLESDFTSGTDFIIRFPLTTPA